MVLSVIVPIYNGETYMSKCLDSLIKQKYKDMEIICVDDGSTDNSLAICERYVESDSRFKIITKANEGVASARKAGMQEAKGEYITFVDSDDWLEEDMYATLMQAAVKNDADIVVCSYFKDYDTYSETMINRLNVSDNIISGEELIRYAFQREDYRGVAAFLWNKIFRAKLLYNNKVYIRDDLKRGDDVAFLTEAALLSKRNVYVDIPLYHYVQRSSSITHRKNKDNLSTLEHILTGYSIAIELLEKSLIPKTTVDLLKKFYCYHASVLAEIAIEYGDKDRLTQYQDEIKRYYKEYIDTNKGLDNRIERIHSILEI